RDHEPAQVLADGHDAGDDPGAQGQVRGAGLSGDPVLSLCGRRVSTGGADHVRAAVPVWKAMRADRVALLAVLLAGYPAIGLSAQDSEYGIRGLGTPGRWESVRARSTGGAFGPFDPLSPLMEAQLADVGHLTGGAMTAASYRDAETGGATTALRETRFPLLQLAGPIGTRFALGGGFTTYLDRSWDVTLRDSVVLRGVNQPYTDELTSNGSVADLRLAAASRLSPRLALGAAVHVLSGSTRETAERRFDDTTYSLTRQTAEVGSRAPIRFGVRGGQMPFGSGTSAPTEFAVAVGTGRAFSEGRALLDLGLERLERSGAGLKEHVWTVLVGMTIRP